VGQQARCAASCGCRRRKQRRRKGDLFIYTQCYKGLGSSSAGVTRSKKEKWGVTLLLCVSDNWHPLCLGCSGQECAVCVCVCSLRGGISSTATHTSSSASLTHCSCPVNQLQWGYTRCSFYGLGGRGER
jgi:hypothetical protein